jgi:hypothetical protein
MWFLNDLNLSRDPEPVGKRPKNSKAGIINNKSGRTTDLPILTLKNTPAYSELSAFSERYFIYGGPIEARQKNLKV